MILFFHAVLFLMVYLGALVFNMHTGFTLKQKEKKHLALIEENENLEFALQQKIYTLASSYEKDIGLMTPVAQVKYLTQDDLAQGAPEPPHP